MSTFTRILAQVEAISVLGSSVNSWPDVCSPTETTEPQQIGLPKPSFAYWSWLHSCKTGS
jgi:hypothetical protein